jgi:hypothetical protein
MNRCRWRETSFMLHLLSQTVNPPLTLRDCIKQWRYIANRLREPRRSRSRQLQKLHATLR